MFLGNISSPGAEFSDDFQRSFQSFLWVNQDAGSDHHVDSAPDELGDRQMPGRGYPFKRFGLIHRQLDLRSNHDASDDYIYDYMITILMKACQLLF
jgi:hypothetical protein